MARPKVAGQTLREPAQAKCSEEAFYARILRKSVAPQSCGADFAQACAGDMHMDISKEPFYARSHKKHIARQIEHADQTPAFTLTAKSPQCDTLFGEFPEPG